MAVPTSIIAAITIITSLALHFIKTENVRPTAELGKPTHEAGMQPGEPFLTTKKPVKSTALPGLSTTGAILLEADTGISTTKTYMPSAEFNLLKDDAAALTAELGVPSGELGVPSGDETDETSANPEMVIHNVTTKPELVIHNATTKPELVIHNATTKASSGVTPNADSARALTFSSRVAPAAATDPRVQTTSGVSVIKTTQTISATIAAQSSKQTTMKSTVQPNTIGPEFIFRNDQVDPLGDVTISTITSTTPETARTSTATNTRTPKLYATNPYQLVRPLHHVRPATPTSQPHTAASLYSWMLFGRDIFSWFYLFDNQHPQPPAGNYLNALLYSPNPDPDLLTWFLLLNYQRSQIEPK